MTKGLVRYQLSGDLEFDEGNMEKLDSEYPTEGQMKEMWEALEIGDDQEILAVLQKRKLEREKADKTEEVKDRPESDSRNSHQADGTV